MMMGFPSHQMLELFLEGMSGKLYVNIQLILMNGGSGLIAAMAWDLTFPGNRENLFVTSSIYQTSARVSSISL